MQADPTPRRGDAELLALVHARADGVRQRRQRSRFLGLGTAAVVTLIAGIGAAADSGTPVSRPIERAAEAPAEAAVTAPETTTTAEVTTTTTIATTTTLAAATTAPTTTPTAPAATRASVTTAPPIRHTPPPTVQAFVTEVSPSNHNTGRVYVSAKGDATGGYVSRMTLTWGDGSAPRTFDYPSSSCQAPGGAQPHDVQVADDNHAYPAPASYTVRLLVTATTCDGSASGTAGSAVTVTYP